jgi:dephospho-CoA kinase
VLESGARNKAFSHEERCDHEENTIHPLRRRRRRRRRQKLRSSPALLESPEEAPLPLL